MNPTVQEMLQEAAADLAAQAEAAKARDPLAIALRELEEAKARIQSLETVGNDLFECASQLGWTSCEDTKWIRRAEKATEAWKSLK